MPFAPSIVILSLVQAGLIAAPATTLRLPVQPSSRWWALVLPGSVIVVIAGIALLPGLADGLTYLALVAVPPLAAIALARIVRGGHAALAALVIPLFVVACGPLGSFVADASALAL